MTTIDTKTARGEFDHDGMVLTFVLDEQSDWRLIPDVLAEELREFDSEWNVGGFDPADLKGQLEMLDALRNTSLG